MATASALDPAASLTRRSAPRARSRLSKSTLPGDAAAISNGVRPRLVDRALTLAPCSMSTRLRYHRWSTRAATTVTLHNSDQHGDQEGDNHHRLHGVSCRP